MELPADARTHVQDDLVAWLTTVTASGSPSPTPVWFIDDGDDIVVFTDPASHKVANIERQARVTVHFNSDPAGEDVVVLRAKASIERDQKLSTHAGYVSKYKGEIERLNYDMDWLDSTFSTRLSIKPLKVWSGDPA